MAVVVRVWRRRSRPAARRTPRGATPPLWAGGGGGRGEGWRGRRGGPPPGARAERRRSGACRAGHLPYGERLCTRTLAEGGAKAQPFCASAAASHSAPRYEPRCYALPAMPSMLCAHRAGRLLQGHLLVVAVDGLLGVESVPATTIAARCSDARWCGGGRFDREWRTAPSAGTRGTASPPSSALRRSPRRGRGCSRSSCSCTCLRGRAGRTPSVSASTQPGARHSIA